MNREHADQFTQRASILIDQQRYDEAAAILGQALADDPENDFALYLLAFCRLSIPGAQETAYDTINRALAIDSRNPAYFTLRSQINSKRDKTKQALEDADEAIAIDPEYPFAHIARGQALLDLERWSDAEAAVRQALALDPDNHHAGNLLAIALRQQNRSHETREHIDSLLSKFPNDAMSHANAGWVALERRDLKNANAHFKESLRIDPTCEYARLGLVEAYKAKSPLYRAYLAYCFKMAKLSSGARIGIIIALFVGVKLLRAIFTGDLAFIGSIAVLAYMLFALWSWVAGGVGSLFLLFDKFARHALKKTEKVEAFLVGGNFCIGITGIVAGFLAGSGSIILLGMTLIGAAFPFAMVFRNENRIGRIVYSGLGGTIMLLGLLSPIVKTVPFIGISPGPVAILLAVAVTWMGVFGILRK